MQFRSLASLVAVGYFIVALGSGIVFLTSWLSMNAPGDTQIYFLAVALSAALLVWAWWSILPSIVDLDDTDRKRRFLLVFALASGILAIGYVGELRDLGPWAFTDSAFGGLWFLTTGWVVTIIGLSVAAVGFWRMSRSAGGQPPATAPSSLGRQPSPGQDHQLRGVRASILIGYVVLALGTAMDEWPGRGWGGGDHLMKGVILYNTAVVVSFVLLGSGWWLCLREIPTSARIHQPLRRALRIFGIASGVLIVGNLVLLAETQSFDAGLYRSGFVLCAVGLCLEAAGFLRASTGPRETHPSVATKVELEPLS